MHIANLCQHPMAPYCWQHGGSSTPLVVRLGVAPKWMDLDSNGVLTATVWLRLIWTDFRLAWNPDDHDGIEVFR